MSPACGIASSISYFTVYSPSLVLSGEEINRAFGTNILNNKSQRRVANFDEDALTMAWNAASGCLEQTKTVPDHIFLCSNTLPSWPCGAYLLSSLGLSLSTPVTVISGSWNCAFDTLSLAFHTAAAGKNVLLVATEALSKYALSNPEIAFADSSCAILITPDMAGNRHMFKPAGNFYSADTFEPLICNSDGSTKIFDDIRFTTSKVSQGISELLGKIDKPQIFGFSAFDDKISSAVRRLPQLAKSRFIDDPIHTIGFAGCVQPFLVLSMTQMKHGDIIHLCSLGGGARITALSTEFEKFAALPTGQKAALINGFEHFRNIRTFMDKSEPMRSTFTSEIIQSRDQQFLLNLNGIQCKNCNKIYTIPQSICPSCHEQSEFIQKPLERRGTIFTFAHEYYVPTPNPPVTMLVVDLDGGGRLTVQAADCSPDETAIGNKVKFVLRRYHSGNNLPNYFWKAVLL
ncbi:MAG: OB-fold domain-containing protein [Planctomycetes bacterium]|nr:OB-fold domain-containing protein [Planctomycetota bacterium]